MVDDWMTGVGWPESWPRKIRRRGMTRCSALGGMSGMSRSLGETSWCTKRKCCVEAWVCWPAAGSALRSVTTRARNAPSVADRYVVLIGGLPGWAFLLANEGKRKKIALHANASNRASQETN